MQEGVVVFDYTCGLVMQRVRLESFTNAIAVRPGGDYAILASQEQQGPACLHILNLQTWGLEPVQGDWQTLSTFS